MARKLTLPQPTPSELVEDSKAIVEQSAMSNGVDLSSQKKLNEFNNLARSDKVNGHLHKVTVLGVYFVATMCAIMFFVIAVHMVLPEKLRYLSGDEVSGLYKFLFTGTLGGLVTGFGKKAIK